jgi:hypothetical protein
MESLMMEIENVYEMAVLEFNFMWLVNKEALTFSIAVKA